jgi:hypothetical protein
MRRPIVSTISLALVGALLLLTPLPAGAQRATLTREVAPAGSEPYSTLFSVSLTSGNGTNGFSPDPVPANRILVIEFVSIRAILQPDQTPMISLQDAVNGASHPYLMPMTLHGPVSIGTEWRTTQLVKLYHEGNGVNGPGGDCAREQNSFTPMQCTFVISGYLIAR